MGWCWGIVQMEIDREGEEGSSSVCGWVPVSVLLCAWTPRVCVCVCVCVCVS